MTVYIGTSAGARDLGIVRVRKAWTSSIAYIGETSEIAWANDLYVTVVDDFRIWRRDIYPLDDDPNLVDYEIAYSRAMPILETETYLNAFISTSNLCL